MDTSADRVQYLRKALDLSQEKFAHLLGFSTATIRKWEQNVGSPEESSLEKISTFFDIPANWLKKGEGDPPVLRLIGNTEDLEGPRPSRPILARSAPMPPTKAKHIRGADQKLRQALLDLAAALQVVAQLEESREAIKAIARAQTQVASAQQELGRALND